MSNSFSFLSVGFLLDAYTRYSAVRRIWRLVASYTQVQHRKTNLILLLYILAERKGSGNSLKDTGHSLTFPIPKFKYVLSTCVIYVLSICVIYVSYHKNVSSSLSLTPYIVSQVDLSWTTKYTLLFSLGCCKKLRLKIASAYFYVNL